MSSENDMDMDGLKIKKGLKKFGPTKTVVNDNAQIESAEKAAKPSEKPENEADGKISTRFRILPGGKAEVIQLPTQPQPTELKADIFTSSKTSKSFEANVGVSNEGVSANVGMSMSKSTEVRTGVAAQINKEDVLAEVQAKGKDGKVPLDELSKVLLRQMGIKNEDIEKLEAMDADARAKAVSQISEKLAVALREEKGAELRAGVSVGGRGAPAAEGGVRGPGTGTVANELLATGGALIGGMAALAGGSVRLAGAAAGALGRGAATLGQGIKDAREAKRFDAVSVLPTISEYRVKKVEEAAENYGNAVDSFWKVPPMAAMRHEIEERARKTGISVPDAMAKMKPGGEWADLHDKFVKEVAASPEATQSKVAMDKALSSWIRQYDHGNEELLGADVDGNPNHMKAKSRIDATKDKMEEKAADSPVFGGESESHAERLRAAVQAIIERIKEVLQAVRQKVFGGEAEHAAP